MEEIVNLSEEDLKTMFNEMNLDELESVIEKVGEMKTLLFEDLGVE